MTERSVTVRLLAITSQYDQAMKNSGRVTTDLGTQAQLTGTRVDDLGRKTNQAGNEATLAEKKFRALTIAAAAVGPAIVPLAGGALAGAGALGLMGIAGVLAIKGISAEMSSGTGASKVYTGQLATLHQNLLDLERTAGDGILEPFAEVVVRLQTQMPFLNSAVSAFATVAGKSGSNLEAGLVGVLETAMPLLTQVGADVEGVTARFAAWGENGGGQKFADWAQSELPTIEHDVDLVASAIGRLVAAIAPLGVASLSELGLLAQAINAIPLPVLQQLIPLLVDGYLAFKAYQGLDLISTKVGNFATKLRSVAPATAEQTAASNAMAASAAADAAAIEAASVAQANVMYQTAMAAQLAASLETEAAGEAAAAYVAAAEATEAALADEAAAMVASVEATTAASAASTLAASSAFGPMGLAVGAVTVALGAGLFALQAHEKSVASDRLQVQGLTNDLMASKGAIDANTIADIANSLQKAGAFDAAKKAGLSLDLVTQAAAGSADAMKKLNDEMLAYQTGNPANLTTDQANALYNTIQAVKKQNGALTDAQKVQRDLAAATDSATDSAKSQTLALNGATDAADAFTKALQGISTAAGGDVIRSQDALQKQLNAVADALHAAKGSVDQYSNAGLGSRDAIDQAATSAQEYAAQVYKQTGSINDAVTAYDAWYIALVNTAKSQGLSKDQLDAYLASVGQLPSQVNTALQTMTTVGENASANLVNGAIAGVNGNAGRLSAIGSAAGANVGFGFTTSLFSAVNNAFAALGNLALTARGGSTSSTYNEQVPGTPTSTIKTYAPKLSVGSTSPVIKGGTYTPPKPTKGSSSGKTPAEKAHDAAVAADDLLEAQALAAINPTNKLALAQEAVTDATRRLNNEAKKGTTEYYQDLTKLHQAQSDLTAEIKAEAQARADAQKQLASDEQSYADLMAKETATTQKYYTDLNSLAADHANKDHQLLAQRQTDIEGFAAANQKAVTQWGSSLTWLSSNVENQADQITKWSQLLAQARAKGVSEAVISALGLDQGPQALGQLQQFSTATQAQIDDLNKAVAAKNKAAGQEVTTEAANNYGALGQALLAEQQSYADAVKALQTQFAADMAELAKEAQQAQTAINGDKAVMINGLYTDTATGRGAFYGPNGEPGSATKTAYFNTQNTMPDGRTDYYHKTFDVGGMLMPGHTVAYNGTGRPEHVFTDSQLAALAGTPEVHVYVDGQEFKGLVRVEMKNANAAKKTAILVGGKR